MAEKNILTRIQLKYDSYANWTSTSLGDNKGANYVLKAGEVGICYLPTNSSTEQVVGTTPPQVLFKVGDGTSKFSALPWASAKAADVYEWAKQASLPVTKEGDGNVISSLVWDEATKGLKFTTASVATAEGLNQLTSRVNTIETTYATDTELSEAVQGVKDYTDSSLQIFNDNGLDPIRNNISSLTNDLNSLETLVGTLPEDETVSTVVEYVDKKADDNYNIIADVNDRLAEVEENYYTIEKGTTLEQTVSTLQTTSATKTELAGVLGTTSDAAGATTVHGALKAAQAAQADIDAFFAGAEQGEAALDTLKEIQAFLEGDSEGTVKQLLDDVSSNKETIDNIIDGTTPVEKASEADNAINLGGKPAADYALKTDAQGYANQAETNAKKYADDLAGNYATAAQGAKADTALQKADIVSGTANGTITVKGTDVAVTGLGSAAYTETGAYATSAQGAKADSALQNVAVGTGLTVTTKASGAQTIGIDETVVFILNCGTSTEVL